MNVKAILALVLGAGIVQPALAQQKGKNATPPKITPVDIKTEDFLFSKTPQGELKMHVYYPPQWKNSDARPVIVFFFGGGWKSGSHTKFLPQAQYFASRGLVACCADYRILSIHKTTPDKCVEDAKSAIRWVRGHAKDLGIDPDKVIASGGSAGGHLAAAAALVPGFNAAEDDTKISCIPNALVLFNPALNLRAGITDAAKNDISQAISPTVYLHAKAPPALILFGTADKLMEHGTEYVAKAKALGVRAEMYTAADQPHGFFNRSPWLELTAEKADLFLQSLGYLSGPPQVKLPAGAPSLQ